MKVAVIGATGFVGKAIVKELLDRGHQVTGIARHSAKEGALPAGFVMKTGDVMDPQQVAGMVKGADAVVSAYNAGWANPELYRDFLSGSQSIQSGVKKAGVRRLVVIGGAGSLEIAPGKQLVDTPEFPAEYKAGATAARDYLNILKKDNELDWTFFSPAIFMHAGTSGIRKGVYRKGLDNPVFDKDGQSVLSVEDLAMAIVDELEQAQHIRQRFTAAY